MRILWGLKLTDDVENILIAYRDKLNVVYGPDSTYVNICFEIIAWSHDL